MEFYNFFFFFYQGFSIYLYDNYFQSFLTALRDLTAISISSLMNNKREYFNFKMKFAQSPGNEYILKYYIYSKCQTS